jgi:hypothetical protein
MPCWFHWIGVSSLVSQRLVDATIRVRPPNFPTQAEMSVGGVVLPWAKAKEASRDGRRAREREGRMTKSPAKDK